MRYITLVIVLCLAQTVTANDISGYGSISDSDGYSETDDVGKEMIKVRALLAEIKYEAAVQTLNDLIKVENRNADIWNLLGYSYRKIGKYKKADIAYRKALIYKPDHKGALEYQGELFIATNQLDKARANLKLLEAFCPTGCEELSDLRAALVQVKVATD